MKIDRQLGILSILFNFPMVELVCVGDGGKAAGIICFLNQ